MSGNVFAIGRFVLVALLALGGISAIFWGYRLFLQGSGLSRGIDKLNLQADWGKVSFAGMSVGSVLMLTSVIWGGLAYMSVPELEMAEGGITKITQVPGSDAVASAVGATIVGQDMRPLGTINDVLMASPTQAAGYVVGLAGNNKLNVFVGANTVKLGKEKGTATVNMTTDQFMQLKPISKAQDKWQLQLQ